MVKHVRLRGLYDDRRAEELAQAMIPIIRGECSTIDMTAVEHIERVALTGFLPLIKKLQPGIKSPKIGVIGMNEEVERTLHSTGLIRYFRDERRKQNDEGAIGKNTRMPSEQGSPRALNEKK